MEKKYFPRHVKYLSKVFWVKELFMTKKKNDVKQANFKLVEDACELLSPWLERLDLSIGKSSDSIDTFFSKSKSKEQETKD